MKRKFNEDLTGKVFNRWTVIKFAEKRKKYNYWLVQCKCGALKMVEAQSLKNNKSQSCGCFLIEKLKMRTVNHIGSKFGKLTVIQKVGKDKCKGQLLKCQCSCGNITIVSSTNLVRKSTRSCGCFKTKINKKRKGELNPNWNTNLTTEKREQRKQRHTESEYVEWRKKVYKRDNYICQVTGIKGNGNICVHHLESWHANKNLRFEILNGITILQSIHKFFHKLYGNRNNTKQQFEEFKKRYDTKEFGESFY